MARTEPEDELEALRREAVTLTAAAEAAGRTYDRGTWLRLALVFFPVPFFVVLFRLQIEAWAYYAAGLGLFASAALMVALDGRAQARRDRAIRAAAAAREAYDAARR